jgi:hypothetical protein
MTDFEVLPSIQLSFRFQGEDLDPDEITRWIGIQPTTIFRVGDPIAADGAGRRRRPGWRFAIEERAALDLDGMLVALRERVSVPAAVVRQLCVDLDVAAVVVCGVLQREYESAPSLKFTPEFLDWVSELGASLDVDIWI